MKKSKGSFMIKKSLSVLGFLYFLISNSSYSAELGEKVKFLYKYIDENGNLLSQTVQFEVINFDPFINAILLSKKQLDSDGRVTTSEKWFSNTDFLSKRTIQTYLDQCNESDKTVLKIKDPQTGEEKDINTCRISYLDTIKPFSISQDYYLYVGDIPIFGIARGESFHPRMVYQIIPQSPLY